jgi:flagellar motility protein MotE (MotC chaperone)
MTRILQSGWFAMLLGALLFLGVTAVLMARAPLAPVNTHELERAAAQPEPGPAWDFVNPELDRLVDELKKEKEVLDQRAQQLKELADRLEAERAEINVITQAVHRIRSEFEQKVVQVREEEVANLKRLAKMYASMSPEDAAGILRQMDDEPALKFMVFMKDAETGPILEALSKLGDADAKRAAALTDRLRTTVYRAALPKQP